MSKLNIIKLIHFFCIVCIIPGTSGAQTITAGGTIGLGTYDMTILKKVQDLRMQYAGVPAEITDDFPMNWIFGAELGFRFKKIPSKLAGFFQYSSTGSRASSSDYSGTLRMDLIVDCYQYGLAMEQDFFRLKFISFSAYGNVSYLFSTMKYIDYLKIYDDELSQEEHFQSTGFGLEPGISVGFNIPFFRISLFGGYLFSFSHNLLWNGKKDAYLELSSNEYAKAEWNGLRFGIKTNFIYDFGKKNLPKVK